MSRFFYGCALDVLLCLFRVRHVALVVGLQHLLWAFGYVNSFASQLSMGFKLMFSGSIALRTAPSSVLLVENVKIWLLFFCWVRGVFHPRRHEGGAVCTARARVSGSTRHGFFFFFFSKVPPALLLTVRACVGGLEGSCVEERSRVTGTFRERLSLLFFMLTI